MMCVCMLSEAYWAVLCMVVGELRKKQMFMENFILHIRSHNQSNSHWTRKKNLKELGKNTYIKKKKKVENKSNFVYIEENEGQEWR